MSLSPNLPTSFPAHRNLSRRFPSASWCWPQGPRELLLRAALVPDPAAAEAALNTWLAHHQLDDLSFAEHRLLAAIADRFGKNIKAPAVAGRLAGLQRQLWTQSRLRVHHVLPMLQALQAAGVELMLLKGAARIALHPEVQRSRAHQDVDIMVKPEQMQKAAQVFAKEGWQSARGDSALAAIGRAPDTRAINFQNLPWGDVDLHRNAYHGRASHPQCDADLWQKAQSASYFGLNVVVPEPAERLALALSHGAWSPEAHSDWLLDAADILARDPICWTRFLQIIRDRRLEGQVQIGLSFLFALSEQPPPPALVPLLEKRSGWTTVLIGRDPTTLSRPLRLLRKLCYHLRRHDRSAKSAPSSPLYLCLARPAPTSSGPLQLTHGRAYSQSTPPSLFRATVIFKAPPLARRIELELNSATANLARFRIFARPNRQGYVKAKLAAQIPLSAQTEALELRASPSKLLAGQIAPEDLSRYGACPFTLELTGPATSGRS